MSVTEEHGASKSKLDYLILNGQCEIHLLHLIIFNYFVIIDFIIYFDTMPCKYYDFPTVIL